jgi:glycerophosphoryl diester phosphodiesterase
VKKPLIIAHRGASALAPENTLAAFRRAIADGAEGIEFDVRLAKDNVPVVIHDADLKRVGARNGSVGEYTSAELGKIDVGSWFNRQKPEKANERFAAKPFRHCRRFWNFCAIIKA